MSEMLDAALDYARRGLPVFPCNPSTVKGYSKRPLTEHGFKDATTDPEQITRWWTRWPEALIGASMGSKAGIFGIDPDVAKEPGDADGLTAWSDLVEQHGGIPHTHSHVSPSGGLHVLFRWRADRPVTNREGALPKGINVRGEGGYLIMPPSKLADGKAYIIAEVFDFWQFADPPDWLLDLIEARPEKKPEPLPEPLPVERTPRQAHGSHDRYVETAVERECQAVEQEQRGGRNNRLNTAAFNLGTLVGAGALDAGRASSKLFAAATATGLVAADGKQAVMATIESGLTSGAKRPRKMPEAKRRDESRPADKGDSPADRSSEPQGPLVLFYGDAEPEPPPWLVENVLPQTQTAIVAGQFSAGKTFVAIDLSVAVMLGLDFAGHKVDRTGAVLWLAAEAANEVDFRLKAAALHRTGDDHKGKLPFCRQAFGVPQLTAPDAFDKLMAIVAAAQAGFAERFENPPLVMIVVDTLNSAAEFENQNEGSEAMRVWGVLRRVSDATGALVLLIDHFGKMVETGVKGTIDKSGAADAILSTLADKSADGSVANRRMSVLKLRTGVTGETVPFKLKQVAVNEWGVTSCGVDWEAVSLSQQAAAKVEKPKPDWTRNGRLFKAAMLEAMITHGKSQRPFGFETAGEIKTVEVSKVRAEFYARYPADTQDAKKKQFRRELDAAASKALIAAREIDGVDWLWFVQTADAIEGQILSANRAT